MIAGLVTAAAVFVGINNMMGLNTASFNKNLYRLENVPQFVTDSNTELFDPMNIGSRFNNQQPYTKNEKDGPFGVPRFERESQPGTHWYDFGSVTNEY